MPSVIVLASPMQVIGVPSTPSVSLRYTRYPAMSHSGFWSHWRSTNPLEPLRPPSKPCGAIGRRRFTTTVREREVPARSCESKASA